MEYIKNGVGFGLHIAVYAASAAILRNPIGVIGGATHGAVQILVGFGVNKLSPKSVDGVIKFLTTQIFPIIVAWQAVNLFIAPLTAKSTVLLIVVALSTEIAIAGLFALMAAAIKGKDLAPFSA